MQFKRAQLEMAGLLYTASNIYNYGYIVKSI
jgi:hypothetical protein